MTEIYSWRDWILCPSFIEIAKICIYQSLLKLLRVRELVRVTLI